MKEHMTIRPAAAADARDFADVLCKSWNAAYKTILTPEELAKYTNVETRTAQLTKWIPSGQGQYLIAYDYATPCGVCSTGPSRDGDMEGCGEVVAIYALPSYWGHGVGQALMDAAVDGLRQQGYAQVMLWVFEANARARAFYEKCGFVFDGTYKESGFGNAPGAAREVRYRKTITK